MLWLDKQTQVIYRFGGLQQDGFISDNTTSFESIWGFQTDAGNSAAWIEVIGPASAKSFPRDILGTSMGVFCSDDRTGYYLGGFISNSTSSRASTFFWNSGLLRFDFETLTLTNSSELGFKTDPDALVNVPTFGVLIALGGGVTPGMAPYNLDLINIWDKANQKWHFQVAEGDIPSPRGYYCAVGVQGNGDDNFEM